MKLGRGLVVLGSAILLLVAVLHGMYYSTFGAAIAKSNLPASLAAPLYGLFLALSAQLVILSILFVVLAWKRSAKTLLLLAGLIPLAEFLLFAHFAGWFLGNELLAAGTACVLAGALLLPRNTAASASVEHSQS